jgi:hypothetical protein
MDEIGSCGAGSGWKTMGVGSKQERKRGSLIRELPSVCTCKVVYSK